MDRAAFYGALRKRESGLFGTSLSQSQVEGTERILDEGLRRGTPLRHLAYILATAYHEVGGTMQPIIERGQRSYFDKYDAGTRKGADLGNVIKGDGYRYRGRGFVQVTGRSNYEKFGISASPDSALEMGTAVSILFDGMTKGMFTGKKLSDYINENKVDYRGARRIVNGTDRAADIAKYAVTFEAALRVAGYVALAPVAAPPAPAKPVDTPKPQPVPQPVPVPPVASKPARKSPAAAIIAAVLAIAAAAIAYFTKG